MSQQRILQGVVADCRRPDAPPVPPVCPPPARRDPRARASSAIASGRRRSVGGASMLMRTWTREPALTTSRGLHGSRPTCTWPASIQPLMRVRECSGSSRASALSRRCPANSCRDFEVDDLELCVHGALEASGGPSGILPRFLGTAHCKESLVRLRDLVHPCRILLLAIGIAVLAAGCRSHRDDAKSGPETIYARAQKAMKNSSYGEAIKQLETLQSRFPVQRARAPGAARSDLRVLQESRSRSGDRCGRYLHSRKSDQSAQSTTPTT